MSIFLDIPTYTLDLGAHAVDLAKGPAKHRSGAVFSCGSLVLFSVLQAKS
jgi:hypothetical protein